ncbi:MAG: tRNA-dihydrouridine synthase [Nitrospiraceae bacterium]
MIPLSVKTRLGYDSSIVEQWVDTLLAERPVAITIHGRTLQQMYRGGADWSAIGAAAALVRRTDTLILGNGDLMTLADVVRRVKESHVHGALVGRGTLGMPWFFRHKERAREAIRQGAVHEGEAWEAPMSLAERMTLMLDHAKQYEAVAGLERFRSMRKHLGWYCKGFPHAAAMRAKMFQVSNVSDVEQVIQEFCGDVLGSGEITPPARETSPPLPESCLS